MPAAAVILAPVAYTKIVAVKKLVVGPLLRTPGAARAVSRLRFRAFCPPPRGVILKGRPRVEGGDRFAKIRVLRAGPAAWIVMHGTMEDALGPGFPWEQVDGDRGNDR